jgi:integrase
LRSQADAGKGGKVVTVPLAPRTARAIDLAIGERTEGPLFMARDDRRLHRYGAGRIVRMTARRAGIAKLVTPAHAAARVHHRSLLVFDAGVPLRDVQEAASHADPDHNAYDRPAAAWTGTRPTSSPPTSPAPRGSPRGQAPVAGRDATAGKHRG